MTCDIYEALYAHDIDMVVKLADKPPKNISQKRIHICENCGTAYIRCGSKQRFCSQKCAFEYRRDHPSGEGKVEVTCERCGKKFVAYKSQQRRFCSQSCVRGEARKMKEPLKLNCQLCGKEFTTTRKNQKYCSHECRTEAATIKRREKIEQARKERAEKYVICKFCGKKVKRTAPHQVFCSERCADKFHSNPDERKAYATPEQLKGECIRCSRPAVPGQKLCKHHLELQMKRQG